MPTDFAATNLHQRAYDIPVAPPVDELSEHNRVLAALPKGERSGGAPSQAGDHALIVGLVIVGLVIVGLVLVLLVAGVGVLLGPE